MGLVSKSVLVPYANTEMFALVSGIESYPQFLPWCAGAHVLDATPESTTARLDVDYAGVRTHWTTINTHRAPDEISIALADGPFRVLDGRWRFTSLAPRASKVALDLRYEFATRALERVVGPVFGRIASSFIDAFVKRAEAVYGAGAAA